MKWKKKYDAYKRYELVSESAQYLFVNDVAKIFKFAKLLMYADDMSYRHIMSLYAVVNNENDYKALQDDLNNVFLSWRKLDLKLNYIISEKSFNLVQQIQISTYTINNNLLAVSESEIILGMTVDNLLVFDKHIYSAVRKGYNYY